MNDIEQKLINLQIKFDRSNDIAERQNLWNQIINLENQRISLIFNHV